MDPKPALDAASPATEGSEADTATEDVSQDETVEATATPTPGTDSATGNVPVPNALPNITGFASLSTSIPILVPAFHGIEPDLELNYDSSRKTKIDANYQGWLGFGWGISGFDVIERASPGYGVPTFDEERDDIYLFNGNELVACGAGVSSPSCSTGGSHATANESYLRIHRNTVTNEWKVTDRQGTVSTFRSVAVVAGNNPSTEPGHTLANDYRWLLTTVTDTHGNIVNYSYSCPAIPVCYPASIAYNGTVITFYRETRPDYLLMANGLDLSETSQRIRTIGITVGGAKRDAYVLDYNQAPLSNASRLIEVGRYGRRATISSGGVVTGGTKKTLQTMTYDDVSAAYTLKPNVASLRPDRPVSVGDLNFDGQDEIFGIYQKEIPSTPHSDTKYQTLFSLVRFTETGSVASEIPVSPEHIIDNVTSYHDYAGRYIGSKNAKDIAVLTFRQQVDPPEPDPPPLRTIIQIDPQLVPTVSDCTPPGFTSVCNAMPTSGQALVSPLVVIDPDATGVDGLHVMPSGAGLGLVGVADIRGNGHQGALFVYSNGSLGFAELINGAWVTSAVGASPCNQATIPFASPTCKLADINGDGATDLVVQIDGWIGIYLSTGKAFKHAEVTIPHADLDSVLQDFDNDGKFEVVRVGPLSPVPSRQFSTLNVYAIRFQASGHVGVNYPPLQSWGARTMGDFNGDGLPDYFVSETDITMSNPSAGGPNLLRTIKTELGATISATYTPSSRWANTYLPQVISTVSKLGVSDGRGGPVAETSYAYAAGKYDPAARRFLGFRFMSTVKPRAYGEAASPTVDSVYRQDVASAGLVELKTEKDGAGVTRRQTAETYVVNTAVKPYYAKNTRTDTTLTEATSATLRVDRTFDIYNNITQKIDYGRIDQTGDETTSAQGIVPNTTSYIVALPRAEVTHAGVGTSNPIIQYRQNYYDESVVSSASPVKGDLTWVQDWTDITSTPQKTQSRFYDYDTYGNKLREIDGAGNKTEWIYDSVFHLYPVTERAPRYFANGGLPADTRFVSTATYPGAEAACEQPKTKTDFNGIVLTYVYDDYCRLYSATSSATGAYALTVYENEGNALLQAIGSYAPLPNSAGMNFTRSYYDGLGRVWRVQSPGDVSGGATRITDTTYDLRGNVQFAAFPRFAGDAAQVTSTTYDWADRPLITTNPDLTVRARTYDIVHGTGGTINPRLYAVTLVNEVGSPTRTIHSTRGDVVVIDRDFGGLNAREARGYDLNGRLIMVTVPSLASWSYIYDLLGNRLKATDPDLGTWTYAYDGANRLVSQIDARGAVTTIAYDQMGRVTLKQATLPGESAVTLAQNTYDQALAGYYNIGQLTRAENPAALHAYNYDGFGKVRRDVATIDTFTHTTTITRDASGQPVWTQYLPAQLDFGTALTPLQYTNGGRLRSAPGFITTTSYEADGQTNAITYANGVSTTFTYSANRRWLNRIKTQTASNPNIVDQTYTRDNLGRITGISGPVTGLEWTYGYDALNRVTSATNSAGGGLSETFTYALNDNLLFRTRMGSYVYPAATSPRPHAPTSIGAISLTYDGNGNMVSDVSRVFTWDAGNRLASFTAAGSTRLVTYGPDGSRTKKMRSTGANGTIYPDASVEINIAGVGNDAYTRYPHPDISVQGAANESTTRRSSLFGRGVSGQGILSLKPLPDVWLFQSA